MNQLIIQADAWNIPLADKSVHCCVTSPPYWGLRDYGVSGQLGLEKTPEEYIERMVQVFREVKRVLRDDGTLWLNMGDSYANDGKWGGETGGKQAYLDDNNRKRVGREKRFTGLKPKDLVGVPWMLAFALRADGWYLRSDIIWSKPNPMPESVTDRPTKAHEYIFLFSKSEKYYYDADAILEPISENTRLRISQNLAAQIGSKRANGGTRSQRPMKTVVRSKTSWNGAKFDDPRDLEIRPTTGRNRCPKDEARDYMGLRPADRFGRGPGWRKKAKPGTGIKYNDSFADATCLAVEARNKRSVWTVNVQGFSEAHFATFPEDLIKPCILAGCPEGGIVLDPFVGSGTTLLVARNLHCHAVGIELNPAYIEIAKGRTAQEVLTFSA